jgi:hypothetical protein
MELITYIQLLIIPRSHALEENQHDQKAPTSNEICELVSANDCVVTAESTKGQDDKINECKKSSRIRKTPRAKTNDFLR